MNLATMTTQAPAVREHGGGRARRYLLTLLLMGRHPRPNGGDIDRRGEAATYSNPLPANCAAAVHPTTGVRRARNSSPSLRSQSRPHAQLVEGYGCLWKNPLGVGNSIALSQTLVLHPNSCATSPNGRRTALQNARPVRRQRHRVPSGNQLLNLSDISYSKERHVDRPMRKALLKDRSQQLSSLSQPGSVDLYEKPLRSRNLILDPKDRGTCLIGRAFSQPRHANFLTDFRPVSTSPVSAMPQLRDPDGNTNSHYRSHSLDPTCLLLHAKMIQQDEQRPAQDASRDKRPDNPDACQLHVLGHLHAQWLLATKSGQILPPFLGGVHGAQGEETAA